MFPRRRSLHAESFTQYRDHEVDEEHLLNDEHDDYFDGEAVGDIESLSQCDLTTIEHVFDKFSRAKKRKITEGISPVSYEVEYVLTRRNLKKALRSLGNRVTMREVDELLATSQSKRNADDYMNREDFVRLFDISLLHEVFEKIDRNHSGQITFDDLESLMDEIGIRTSSTSIHDMFTELDRNSNGSVSFIEFYNRFKFVPHANIERVGKVWASVGGIDWGLDHAAFILPDLDRLVNPKSKEFIKFLTVGGICTIVSRTLTAPLERLKLQAQTEGLASSMISELRMIVKNEGWKGLFAGNWTNCLRIFPTIAIGCYAYVHIVNYFGLKNGAQNPETATRDFLIRLGAGATGGMLASFITYPLDIIRTRLTLPNQGISSPLESSHFPRIFARSKMLNVGRDIVHNEGFKGLFRGSAAAVMSIGPFILVQNSMFNVLKTFAQEELGCKPTPNMLLTCGAVSGLLAQTAVYPLDIVRRRIQLSIVDTGISTLSSLKEIAASEGIKGLYQGILPTALKVAPAVAISLTVRDLIRPYFT